jgi:site-specific DNA-methyltransferase (adenine-specific)
MISEMERPLLEDDCDTFIRYNEALGIFRKIRSFREQSFADIVSANDPFGYDVRENNSYKRIKPNFSMIPFDDCIEFYYNGWRKDGVGYIGRNTVDKNNDWIDLFKVLIPQAWGIGNARVDWVNPFIAGPNSACTETYIVIGPFQSADTAQNALSYMQTRFFHLLVSLIKISQHATAKAYTFVPIQDFSEAWTDEKLYAKYGLTEEEIAFIESMVRPMDLNGETTDE